MSRPRLTIGTFGAIACTTAPSGKVRARTLYRDWDGAVRKVQATAASEVAAVRALKAKLVDRTLLQPAFTALTPDSSFAELAPSCSCLDRRAAVEATRSIAMGNAASLQVRVRLSGKAAALACVNRHCPRLQA